MATKPDMEKLDLTSYSAQGRYNYAKLYTLWLASYQAKRLQAKGITVNSTNPGNANSNFGKSGSKGLFADLFYATVHLLNRFLPLMNTVEGGAAANIYLATSNDLVGVTGKFYSSSHGKVSETRLPHKGYSLEKEKLVHDYYYKLFLYQSLPKIRTNYKMDLP